MKILRRNSLNHDNAHSRAFASYVTSAGGCDKIQNIDCDATNSQVITAYRDYKAMGSKYQDALDCIVKRCALTGSS